MKNKDYYTMRESERFDYSTIDVEYLRTLQLLPDWLKTHPHATTKVDNDPVYRNDEPPGYPTLFRRKIEYRNETIFVIPDPLNVSHWKVEYRKEKKYIPDLEYDETTHKRTSEEPRNNRYYVVTRKDCARMFNPLSWDSLRMQLWECDMYYHKGHEYKTTIKDKTFRWPKYRLDSEVHEGYIPRGWEDKIKDEVKDQMKREYEIAKAAEMAEWQQQAKQWVKPENNMAVFHIQKYFPLYQPNLKLIANHEDSPAWKYIDAYRWYYVYASLNDQYADPIFRIHHKMPEDKEGATWKK